MPKINIERFDIEKMRELRDKANASDTRTKKRKGRPKGLSGSSYFNKTKPQTVTHNPKRDQGIWRALWFLLFLTILCAIVVYLYITSSR